MTDQEHEGPRIVVGVDGSDHSKLALRWAVRLARSFGARIEAVSSWEFPTTYGWAALPTEWNPGQDMAKVLTATVDEVLGSDRPTDLVETVLEGGAAMVLLARSESALMLVVGSRGHGGFAGLLLGSVSASVAEHATCPVLVVHGDTIIPEATA